MAERGVGRTEHPSQALLLLAFDSEAAPSEQAAVREHVGQCQECEKRWASMERLSSQIAAVERETEGPLFELQLPSTNKVNGLLVQRAGSLRVTKTAGLIAAGLALAAGFWFLTRTPVSVEKPVVADGGSKETPSVGNVSGHGGGSGMTGKPEVSAELGRLDGLLQRSASAVAQNRIPPATRRTRRRSNAAAPGEGVTAHNDRGPKELFWALPYSNPALAAEGVHLVRVALPREAFLLAGVPAAEVPGTAPREPVVAEVLLGSDGLPSAIRPAHSQAASYHPPR